MYSKIPDKEQKFKDKYVIKTYIEETEDKGNPPEKIEVCLCDEDRTVFSAIKKDGKFISVHALQEVQQSGLYKDIVKKLGMKEEDIVYTSAEMAAEKAGQDKDKKEKEENKNKDKMKKSYNRLLKSYKLRKDVVDLKSGKNKPKENRPGYDELKARMAQKEELKPGSREEKIKQALASQSESNPYATPGPGGGSKTWSERNKKPTSSGEGRNLRVATNPGSSDKERTERVKASLAKINQLMAELKSKQSKTQAEPTEKPKPSLKLLKSVLAKKQGVPEGVDPKKQESCVKKVKKQSPKVNPYAVCNASLKKDDMSHKPGSPEDSAHDVVEENSSIKGELSHLNSSEKKKMLEHLREYNKNSQWKRSKQNQELGNDLNKSKDDKKYSKTVTDSKTGKKKTVRYGAKGYKIAPGTKKGNSYCARSYGDMKSHNKDCSGKDRNTPLCLSRQKWKCSGKYSLKKTIDMLKSECMKKTDTPKRLEDEKQKLKQKDYHKEIDKKANDIKSKANPIKEDLETKVKKKYGLAKAAPVNFGSMSTGVGALAKEQGHLGEYWKKPKTEAKEGKTLSYSSMNEGPNWKKDVAPSASKPSPKTQTAKDPTDIHGDWNALDSIKRKRELMSVKKPGILNKDDNRCWDGYEPTPGKKAYSKGSCRKISKSSAMALKSLKKRSDKSNWSPILSD